jgi:hypothetical protein
MNELQYHHTGKYDLATDQFIGGGVRCYVNVPPDKDCPISRLVAIDADTPEELAIKLGVKS